jgi:hypothetical protein
MNQKGFGSDVSLSPKNKLQARQEGRDTTTTPIFGQGYGAESPIKTSPRGSKSELSQGQFKRKQGVHRNGGRPQS